MKLKFCGAARTVTGSCHMISFDGGKILVDCGMRQGSDAKTELGESRFPFNPGEISAVVVTHAHIDHTGMIPLLVKQGFKGKIFSTGATAQLSAIMLPDSGHIQEQEAQYINRKNERAGKPRVEPLYTVQDAMTALKQYVPVDYNEPVEIMKGVKASFIDVGHLLGSAAIELWVTEGKKTTKLLFSGDIGRDDRPIIRDPQDAPDTDYLIVEGTYGDREHEISTDEEKEKQFADVLRSGIVRGGNIVIPSFAVGRTQELLYYIKKFLVNNTVPGLERVPVYIDSPLGIEATKVFERCASGYYDEEAAKFAKSGSLFDFRTLRVAQSVDESKMINAQTGVNIIISSSGMCEAGRIRHHLKHNLYRADSTVLFVGYQADGTLGRVLTEGVKKVKLFGEEVSVNADIRQIEGFSGHAGASELDKWVTDIPEKPKRVFLVHGEESVLENFGSRLSDKGYDVTIPQMLEEIDLETSRTTLTRRSPKVRKMRESDVAARINAVNSQTERVEALLRYARGKDDDEMRLKLMIMEADLKSFADKWEDLLK